MNDNPIGICDECGSEFVLAKSKMQSLCPNCAHIIYGYKNCNHIFEDGKCILCLWNGNESDYIKSLKKQTKFPTD